jgi:hypothetical protein
MRASSDRETGSEAGELWEVELDCGGEEEKQTGGREEGESDGNKARKRCG